MTPRMEDERRLSDEDFSYIYSRVPRLTVDVVINDVTGVLLVERAIEPWKGYWHLPGGTVYIRESLHDAAKRIAQSETGLEIEVVGIKGVLEFHHEQRGTVDAHTVSAIVEARATGGTLIKDNNASDIGYFKTLPNTVIPEHKAAIEQITGYIS